ncbi:uncharacterized protein MONBRDRAFT_29898 [Monosiga brevicollis MX1]|uniref:Nudix hydrolase domain-containing protein n=1 Tax=Monosiga brevicollis TaxID=81824 RepID=A9VCG1_MONBE|nr:uncharacterized protein MONBRDRAFT_29898 [Monosiga brevicollis MX1]EDQ84743.1 predicted protein [Monosiga brevicollis MX1]|eukprot:XP_001750393.1 hypothetical protein [Monosiga brevicollis MX1]
MQTQAKSPRGPRVPRSRKVRVTVLEAQEKSKYFAGNEYFCAKLFVTSSATSNPDPGSELLQPNMVVMADMYLKKYGSYSLEIPIEEIKDRLVNRPPSPVLLHCGTIILDSDCKNMFVMRNGPESFIKLKYRLALLEPEGSERIHTILQATGEKETCMWSNEDLTNVIKWNRSKLKPRKSLSVPGDDVLKATKGIVQKAAQDELERRMRGERPHDYDGSPIWCVPGGMPDQHHQGRCEGALRAARRELREEALQGDGDMDELLTQSHLNFTFDMVTPDGGTSRSKFFVFHVKNADGRHQLIPKGKEFQQVAWDSFGNIASGLTPMGKYSAFLRFATADEWRNALDEIQATFAPKAARQTLDVDGLAVGLQELTTS